MRIEENGQEFVFFGDLVLWVKRRDGAISRPMKIPESVATAARELAEPVSPAGYFEGWNRLYAVPVDDVLLFSRTQTKSLQRRTAESHLHRRFVCVICLENAGTVKVDGVPFELRPGQAHVVFPQSFHSFSRQKGPDILWMMITFETREPEKLAILRQRTLQLTKADLNRVGEMAEAFNRGMDAQRSDELCARVSEMLATWCLNVRRKEKGAPVAPARRYAGLWKRLQAQLERLPPEELRVAPLARRLSMSERHLRQKFQDQFGVSIGAYLRNYRLRRAIGLLVSTDLSQTEIADRCGYRSPASFHRAFIRHTGMKPGEFR